MFESRLAENRTDYVSAYQLLYEAYLSQTFIPPTPTQIHYRPSFGRPVSRTIVASTTGTTDVVGTLTVVRDSPAGVPLASLYPREVEAIRQSGGSFAEACGLAVRPSARSQSLGAFSELMRCLFQYGRWLDLDWIIMAVHPRKARFYQRRLGFAPFGPVRAYAAVAQHPAMACEVDMRRLRETMSARVYDFHLGTPIAASRFIAPPMSPVDRAYFARLTGAREFVPCSAPGAA